MFQNCLKYYLSRFSLDISNLMLLKKIYTGIFQGKTYKLRCSLAKWPNLHSKNLKNEQLEFLQPIFENCLPNGFHYNYKLGQIYYKLRQLLLLQIKTDIITNRGSFCHYKLRQTLLLQIGAELLQIEANLLQTVAAFTNWNNYYKSVQTNSYW